MNLAPESLDQQAETEQSPRWRSSPSVSRGLMADRVRPRFQAEMENGLDQDEVASGRGRRRTLGSRARRRVRTAHQTRRTEPRRLFADRRIGPSLLDPGSDTQSTRWRRRHERGSFCLVHRHERGPMPQRCGVARHDGRTRRRRVAVSGRIGVDEVRSACRPVLPRRAYEPRYTEAGGVRELVVDTAQCRGPASVLDWKPPWPFPLSLMIVFRVEWACAEIDPRWRGSRRGGLARGRRPPADLASSVHRPVLIDEWIAED